MRPRANRSIVSDKSSRKVRSPRNLHPPGSTEITTFPSATSAMTGITGAYSRPSSDTSRTESSTSLPPPRTALANATRSSRLPSIDSSFRQIRILRGIALSLAFTATRGTHRRARFHGRYSREDYDAKSLMHTFRPLMSAESKLRETPSRTPELVPESFDEKADAWFGTGSRSINGHRTPNSPGGLTDRAQTRAPEWPAVRRAPAHRESKPGPRRFDRPRTARRGRAGCPRGTRSSRCAGRRRNSPRSRR